MPDRRRPTPADAAARRREWHRRHQMFRRRRAMAVAVAGVVALSIMVGLVRLVDRPDAAHGAPQDEPSLAATTTGTTPRAGATNPPTGTGAHRSSTPRTRPASATPSGGVMGAAAVSVPKGDGRLTTFAAPRPDHPGKARSISYAVQVEGGIGADGRALAAAVQQILQDPRGWQRASGVRFVQLTDAQRAAGRKADITVIVASAATVDRLCAPLKTEGKVSCGRQARAVLNYWRWVNGVDYYGADLAAYRQYMVNHEVGHLLGFPHVGCPGKGRPAPIMVQQTYGLDGCTPNPWPTRT